MAVIIISRAFGSSVGAEFCALVPATAGAMICLETPREPHSGHSTKPRADWSS